MTHCSRCDQLWPSLSAYLRHECAADATVLCLGCLVRIPGEELAEHDCEGSPGAAPSSLGYPGLRDRGTMTRVGEGLADG